ncbi:MAG TPA: zinc ABC transporter substrate-binding protein [Candidatus Eisenbacteria bacterium]|nr:zinc ABC transporter substrate-binding protein [Candidatus Eisenbacteria bacterium]
MKEVLKAPAAMLTVALLLAMTTSTAALTPLRTVAAASQTDINSSSTNTTNTNRQPGQAKINVVTSFFPIYEFVKAVGENRINLSVLIPIGAEPHDFDPTIQEVQKANSANLLVYNGASMEEPWIHNLAPQNTVDTSKGMNLLANPNDPEIKGPNDPHIWLDPVLAIKQVQNIRDGLDKIDPKNAAYYNQNAQNFIGQLNKLDIAFRGNLTSSNCAKRDFIPFHLAFAYFAKRYGLNAHPIHEGLTTNGEVLPQKLVEVVNLAKNLGIKVIYSEDLIDPRSAQAIAEQIPGAKVVVLSPIEGVNATEQKVGITYLDKMYQDLSALKEGLQCKM